MKKTFFLILAVMLLLSALTLTSCSEKKEKTPETFQIEYHLHNDTAVTLKTKIVNGRFTMNTLPTKQGFTFKGLYDAPEGGTQYVNESGVCLLEITDPNLVLHAQWAPKSFFISFDAGEGTLSPASKEMTVVYGSTITAMPIPERDGYSFVGWADANGTFFSNAGAVIGAKQTFNTENYALAETNTVKLYAKYEVRQHKVTFDYNDGSYQQKTITLAYGEKIPVDSFPVMDTGSREIAGWSLSSSFELPFSDVVVSDLTLYAVWKDYRVFTLNDMTGMTQTLKVYKGEAVDLSTVNVDHLRPGYRATGWYSNKLYSGSPITELTYSTPHTTLYANWELATYTLRFDAASAGEELAEITYQMGNVKELPILTKEGYTFNGWCTKWDCSDTPIKELGETMYGDRTLYASFTANLYTVTLHGMGGNLSATEQAVGFETTYSLPIPTRDGYEFLGWYDAEGTGARKITNEKGESLSPYGWYDAIDLYAHWDVQKFTVTFETDGGTVVSPIEVQYNDTLILPEDPTKEGMLLDGWYNKDFTESYTASYRVTGDITLYAKWIQSTAISTADELKAIATNPSANYHLTADINLKGAEWTMIPEFSGTLNGKGHKIYNFSIISTSDHSGFVQINKGKICNLTFSDLTVSASHSSTNIFFSGVIAGVNEAGAVISNCTVTDASGSYVSSKSAASGTFYSMAGAITGQNKGTIDGCHADFTIAGNFSCNDYKGYYGDPSPVYGHFYAGLIVGESFNVVKNCTSTGKITVSLHSSVTASYGNGYAETVSILGGMIGNNSGSVYNCHSNAQLEITDESGISAFIAGGFVGWNSGTISCCSAAGTIKDTAGNVTTDRVGGFVSTNNKTIDNCYTTVSIDLKSAGNGNSRIGGFAYENFKTINSCYCTGDIVTNTTAGTGGFIGINMAGGSITKCFTASNLTTPNATNVGYFVGVAESGSMVTKCYYSNEAKLTVEGAITATPTNTDGTAETPATLQGEDLIYNTLSWDSSIWVIKADCYPTLLLQE
ncbi:MAG: hypothetical protein E7637_02885 [Ruminococcaceae bacterium]|nr:hypothetical protein [Oscillospiraceae bacterium]